MTPTINKSRLMKEAHRIRKVDGYDMSIAMKLAWLTEKNKVKEEVVAYEWNKPSEPFEMPTIGDVMAEMERALTNYYSRGSGVYYGD